WPLFILGPLLVLALRARRLREAIIAMVTAVVAWVVVNAPVFLLYRESWNRFFDLNTTRPIDWGTLWYIGRWVDSKWNTGSPGDQGPFQWLSDHVDPTLNWLTYGLFALSCLGIALISLLAPRRPRLAQVAFLVVAAFLIFSKVWSQQYVLWLLPLIVLARPRWGAILAWSVAEIGYFTAFYAELLGAGGKPVIPEGVFVLASTLRLVTVAVLCGLVIREIWRPELDAVRSTYDDDPDGGVLDGTPDAGWVTTLRNSWVGPRPPADDAQPPKPEPPKPELQGAGTPA
ncbi:MAG TPA: hypothetical protein VF657_20600, partial [Actinoplanes sp.]